MLAAAAAELRDAGIEAGEAAASARWLAEAARRREPEGWRRLFREGVAQRARREPLQYILGSWPFYPLPKELIVRPPVLIPRPETEELVDRIRTAFEAQGDLERFVDIGSGSGAIAVALLHAFPRARAVAVDQSPEAASLTRENAERCGVMARLDVVCSRARDWAEGAPRGGFDLVVSNPPYIPSAELPGLQEEVRCFEDAAALDGGDDGLEVVNEVLCCARLVGAPGAHIFLEVHHTHPAVFEAAAAGRGGGLDLEGLRLVGTAEDLGGQPRFVELRVEADSDLEPR